MRKICSACTAKSLLTRKILYKIWCGPAATLDFAGFLVICNQLFSSLTMQTVILWVPLSLQSYKAGLMQFSGTSYSVSGSLQAHHMHLLAKGGRAVLPKLYCATATESSVHVGYDVLQHAHDHISKLSGVASTGWQTSESCFCRTPVTAEPSTSTSGRQPSDATEDKHIAKLTEEQLGRNQELLERLRGKLVSPIFPTYFFNSLSPFCTTVWSCSMSNRLTHLLHIT